ncbi:MAG: TM1266 family iron-only hydrogenase system putative regulator [Bacillota bacterium]
MFGLTLMGLAVDHRQESSPKLQAVLSEFGEEILLRVGLPVRDGRRGLIALVLEAEEEKVRALAGRLEGVADVTVKTVSF